MTAGRGAGPASGSGGARSPRGASPVLLYDGVCALCNGTVRVVLRLDRRGRIRFAPLSGGYATDLLRRHPAARSVDSLILVEPPEQSAASASADAGPTAREAVPERVLVKSDAVLRLAHHLGGAWRAVGVLKLMPRPLRDWVYDRVARHRYRLFGRLARRPDPPSGVEARFLD